MFFQSLCVASALPPPPPPPNNPANLTLYRHLYGHHCNRCKKLRGALIVAGSESPRLRRRRCQEKRRIRGTIVRLIREVTREYRLALAVNPRVVAPQVSLPSDDALSTHTPSRPHSPIQYPIPSSNNPTALFRPGGSVATLSSSVGPYRTARRASKRHNAARCPDCIALKNRIAVESMERSRAHSDHMFQQQCTVDSLERQLEMYRREVSMAEQLADQSVEGQAHSGATSINASENSESAIAVSQSKTPASDILHRPISRVSPVTPTSDNSNTQQEVSFIRHLSSENEPQ